MESLIEWLVIAIVALATPVVAFGNEGAMQNTSVTASFVSPTTVQVRFELGTVVDAVQTTEFPDFIDPASGGDEGYVWYDGRWYGRIGGPDGQYWMPFDSYLASPIDDLFDTSGDGANRAAPVDDDAGWTVQIDGSAASIVEVSRKSHILDTAIVGWGEYQFATIQNVFIELDAPLAVGQTLDIAFADPDFAPVTVTYDPATVISEAIHVNLVGYDPDDLSKIAYLSSWNGFDTNPALDAGGAGVPQVYAEGTGFDVIDAATGAVVLSGEITLGTPLDEASNQWLNFQGTPVYEMDMSALTAEGRYYVAVDGVGRSATFEIAEDHWDSLFDISFSGFYHQRSGIALDEAFTDFPRPRSLHPDDGVVILGTTVQLMTTKEGIDSNLEEPFGLFADNLTGEVFGDVFGGWHDAGDYDRRTQHMEAARRLIELVEMNPDWAEATSARIPENGNAIPDLLDEAIWGLEVFRRLQSADGGVSGGIESANPPGFGEGSWGDPQTLYAYAPDVWSSLEYAASAAKLATALRPYDAAAADGWLASAQAAWTWGSTNLPLLDADFRQDYGVVLNVSYNVAALELYRATGDAGLHAAFLDSFVYADDAPIAWNAHQYEAAYIYAAMTGVPTNAPARAAGVAALQAQADFYASQGQGPGFGSTIDPYAPYGWGNTVQQPNYSADVLVRLHALTGDAALLDLIQQDVQYTLGANPMNMVYMTGIDDVRSPRIILNADAEVLGTDPPPGITLYGDYNVYDYGTAWYHEEMYADVWPYYYQTPVAESFQGFYLYVPSAEYTVQQGISDMTVVTGYLAMQDATGWQGRQIRGTNGDDRIDGGPRGDSLLGLAGDDVVNAGAGNDLVHGGPGDDVLRGQDGRDTVLGGGGDDRLAGGAGDDVVAGNSGDDALFGGGGRDSLLAGQGDDALFGGGGADLLRGHAGDDTLDGGGGNDDMAGGAGADLFVFRPGFGRDVVRAFETGEDELSFDVALVGTRTGAAIVADFAAVTAAGLVLDFGGSGRVLVQGVLDEAALAGAIDSF